MTVVSSTEKDTLFGCPVQIYTSVTAPYGDGLLMISLEVPNHSSILLYSQSHRSAVELGKDKNLYGLSEEDKKILISSAQHNMKLEEVKRETYNKIRSISELFNRD
jgi:hypothetical protein